jgi:hypothetical protein
MGRHCPLLCLNGRYFMKTTDDNSLIILFAIAWPISVAVLSGPINVGYSVEKKCRVSCVTSFLKRKNKFLRSPYFLPV